MRLHLVAADIGNTTISIGLFRGSKLVGTVKIPTRAHSRYRGALIRFMKKCRADAKEADAVIVSSVVPDALGRFVKVAAGVFGRRVLVVGKDIQAALRNAYRRPRQVGQDRLVNAVAVKEIYGCPAIVIDFGTAVTFDCVSRGGAYLGGLILPGIELSFWGLYERTALLPKVKIAPVSSIIGRDTVESMRAGVLFGFGALCDGLVDRLRGKLGARSRVVATGGNSMLVKRYSGSIRIVDEHLTLKGLRIIFASREGRRGDFL